MDASRQDRNGAAHASVVVAGLEAGDVQHTCIGESPNQFTRFACAQAHRIAGMVVMAGIWFFHFFGVGL
jgi:hypothetical protein